MSIIIPNKVCQNILTYFLNLEEAAQLTDNKMETAQVYLEDMFDHPVKTDVFNEIGRFRYIRQ